MTTRSSEFHPGYLGLMNSPGLDVWLWSADVLEEARVIWLNTATSDSLRPLAQLTLPADLSRPDTSSKLWATIPVYHVSEQ